jgi:hypothetical protein
MYITQLKKNYKIILVIITIIFLYFLFYTDYIVHNQPPQLEQNNKQQQLQQYHLQQQQLQQQQIKHVKFDDKRNLEILFDSEKDRINIDYRVPQLNKLQQISRCTYPMNSLDQMNTKDCTVTGTCITKFSPQEWFIQQRSAKSDLPGFNGSTTTQYQYDENKMIHNPQNENFININRNTNSDTNTNINTNTYQYQNAPFIEDPIGRGSMPYDLCRSCTVGVCDDNTCGSIF